MEREPRDFILAGRAYEAFFNESPQVRFEQLNHEYQMKWVLVARTVINTMAKLKPAAKIASLNEAQAIVDAAPKKGMRIQYRDMSEDEAKRVRTAMHRLALAKRKG